MGLQSVCRMRLRETFEVAEVEMRGQIVARMLSEEKRVGRRNEADIRGGRTRGSDGGWKGVKWPGPTEGVKMKGARVQVTGEKGGFGEVAGETKSG